MPPKKDKKGGSKKSKGVRPAWMSEEMFSLSCNLPKLGEIWSGDIKESSSKKADAMPIPNITRVQAGLYIWQIIFPNNKAAKDKRTDGIKMGLIETSVRVLGSGRTPDMTPAAGILTAMTQESEQCRTAMMESKPALLPALLRALEMDSASLKAALCSLLRVLATSDDTRLRLSRALRDWDWTPLLSALNLQEMSQLGGRNAALDAMLAVEALCSAREGEVAASACTHVHKYGGVREIVQVLQTRISHPMAKAAGITILNTIMRRAPASLCEEIVITSGALAPIVSIFAHDVVPLLRKAHAAAILLRYVLPDSLWKDSSILGAGHKKAAAGGAATAATTAAAAAAATLAAAAGIPPPSASGGDRPATTAAPADGSGPVTAAGGGVLGTPQLPAFLFEGGIVPVLGGVPGDHHGASTSTEMGPPQPDGGLLDEATKREIVNRARRVAEAGAIPWLVRLCAGPDGPLPDLSIKAPEPAPGEVVPEVVDPKGKKGAKKKGGKKKKVKLDPGMAEAQSWATAVLRLVSMGEEMRPLVVQAGALRYLLPLLESRVGPTRWNVRQTLVNMSMTPPLMPSLMLYKVPEYLSGANMPDSHFMRLGNATEQVATPLSSKNKPPPLKPIRNIDGPSVKSKPVVANTDPTDQPA